MKKFMTSLLLLTLFHAQKVQANDAIGAAATTVILIGAAYTVAGLQYDEYMKNEMESWKYDETGLTTSLSRSCNLNMELRLHRMRRQSYIIFTIHNDQDTAISIKTADIYATYSNGAIRRFRSVNTINDIKVENNWTVKGYYPIAEKTELADLDYIDFTIPSVMADGKTSCDIKGRLNRNRSIEPHYMDYNRLLQGQFSVFYGQNAFTSQSLKTSSQNRGLFGLQFAGYVEKNYGVYFGYILQDLKSTNNSAVKATRNIQENVVLGQRDFLIGGAVNFLHGRKYSIDLNAGFMQTSIVNNETQDKEIESQNGVFINGAYNYIFYSSDYIPYRGDYMIGVGALARFTPKFTIGPAQFGGFAFSPYLSFNMGF